MQTHLSVANVSQMALWDRKRKVMEGQIINFVNALYPKFKKNVERLLRLQIPFIFQCQAITSEYVSNND